MEVQVVQKHNLHQLHLVRSAGSATSLQEVLHLPAQHF